MTPAASKEGANIVTVANGRWGEKEWIGLLSAPARRSREQVIVICKNRKALRIKKALQEVPP